MAAILFMVISQWLTRHPAPHTTPPGATASATAMPDTALPHAPAAKSTPPGD
jgi:hypothetical protein